VRRPGTPIAILNWEFGDKFFLASRPARRSGTLGWFDEATVVAYGDGRAMRTAPLSLLVSIVLVAALGQATTGSAAAPDALRIPATADLFAAGLSAPPSLPGGGGTLPPVFQFGPGPGKMLTFQHVTGHVSWTGTAGPVGPSGTSSGKTNLLALGAISGLVAPGWLFLAGVFLGDSAPMTPPPPRLRMENALRLTTVRPKLQQVFYIGDGQTTRGIVRGYVVPANATRLYLGFLDGVSPGGKPAYYGDNTGRVTAAFKIAPGSG